MIMSEKYQITFSLFLFITSFIRIHDVSFFTKEFEFLKFPENFPIPIQINNLNILMLAKFK